MEMLTMRSLPVPAFNDSLLNGVIVVSDDGVIIYANEAAERMFCFLHGQLLQKNLMNLLSPVHHAAYREELRRLAAVESFETGPVLHVDALRCDGSGLPVDLTLSSWRSAGALFFEGVLRDPTFRAVDAPASGFRANDDLRGAEERWRALLEHSADAVLLVDSSAMIRYCSLAARRLLGYGDREVTGASVFASVHPDQREWVASIFHAATTRNELVTQAFRSVREDGSFGWLEATISNQLDHPALQSMIFNCHDITDRVEALDHLWQQEEQYRGIVEAVTDAILIVDLRGVIVNANRAACLLYGYDHVELVGKGVGALVPAGTESRLEEFASRAAAGEPSYAEVTHIRKDGSDVAVIVHGTAFPMNGTPHLLAVISNVSEQKRMQQRLERADRISSLGRLAATIAHEMNNVMMGIMPFAEIIRRRGGGDTVLQNAAGHIVKSVERGMGVTQDILRFTRSTSEPAFEAIDAARFLADVTDELRSRIVKTISLEVFCEEDLYLLGDSAQLQQVITNLVMNAQDAMTKGGVLKIRLVSCSPEAFQHFGGAPDALEAYAHLCVVDQGSGIPPYIVNQIFEPLFTTKGARGTGLGLAIVHQIVIAHEGQIHVQSTPGRGATFHLLLRKSKRKVDQAPARIAGREVWRQIRSVVLVEDEPLVGEGLQQLLLLEGLGCRWFTRGEEALESLQTSAPPDLLILDVGLPDISGMELYRQVAKVHPRLPTIFSTGHGDHRLLDELDPAAPVAFLSKPYAMEMLTSRVESLLASMRPETSG